MKFLHRKLLTALLFLFLGFNAKAVNDTLTIGQAFDWQVGDTFMYRHFTAYFITYPQTVYNQLEGFTVLSRTNYTDSIVYQVEYFNPSTTGFMTFKNPDSSVTTLGGGYHVVFFGFMPFCDTLFNWCHQSSHIDSVHSFLTVNYQTSSFDATFSAVYKEQIGVWWKYNPMWGTPAPPVGTGISLAYYSSGSFSWLDSTLYYTGISSPTPTPTFHLSPNPVTDRLSITTETDAPVDVLIYDMLGNCVLTHKNFSHNQVDINVHLIPPGYYLLKLTDRQGLSSSKGFIIAR